MSPRRAPATATAPVVLEVGKKRTFASALDWPGWSRSARTSDGEEGALAALDAYAARYAAVADSAGCRAAFANVTGPGGPAWTIVDRVDGDATTDFGAPSRPSTVEDAPLTAPEAARTIALLDGCWRMLDSVAAKAPQTLRKGPRGGGRDRDAVVAHVVRAEASYARKLGLREVATPDPSDPDQVEQLRTRIRDELTPALVAATVGEPRRWSARYVVRRMAWHVLDHAWEIEDKG